MANSPASAFIRADFRIQAEYRKYRKQPGLAQEGNGRTDEYAEPDCGWWHE